MAGYSRQSVADIIANAVIKAAPVNAEFNAIRDAFSFSVGHKHDGSSTEGAYIPLIADVDGNNKVVVDTSNNRVSFYSEVSGSPVEQLRIQDGKIVPVTDDDIDLGATGAEFKDLYIDGIGYIDSVVISGGTIDGTVIGGTTPAAGTFTTGTIATADINGGNIDGTTIGATTPAGSTFTTMTATTADINAGTIDGTTIGSTSATTGTFTTATATSFVGPLTGNVTGNVTGNLTGDVTGNVTGNITSTGTSTFSGIDVNGGNIDGTIIGAATPAAITGTTITGTSLVGPLTGNVTGNVTGNLTGNVTGNVTASSGTSTFNNVTVNGTLNMDAATAATIQNLTDPTLAQDAATKNYVDTVVSNLIDSAPGTLDTLNELAAALGDDPNFATTVTDSIATKLSLTGGTMSGNIAMGSNKVTGLAAPTTGTDATNKTYVDSILGSATAAATSATEAAASAAAALVSENNAATSETNAATSETNAATSATNSANSATASASSATASAASASAAATSETNAGNSATAAATSASNAATSESNAATSASAASTSASNAATSASNAATSATNAATSETNAANSATAAAASYDAFDDRYLGAKASDPATDNDGDPLVAGTLYFNTTDSVMKIYDGSAWSNLQGGTATFATYKYTATAGQTVFSGADDVGNTLAIVGNNVLATLNGIMLELGTDYTTTASALTLTSAAALDDELNVYAFDSFSVADYTQMPFVKASGAAANIDLTGFNSIPFFKADSTANNISLA